MADFQYDIGDQIGEFEVVSRSENTLNGELQYTVISKDHAEARRKADEEAAAEAEKQLQLQTGEAPETPLGDAAPAEAPEEPEILHPRA